MSDLSFLYNLAFLIMFVMITKSYILNLQIMTFIIMTINIDHCIMRWTSLFRYMMMIKMQAMILNSQQCRISDSFNQAVTQSNVTSQSKWHHLHSIQLTESAIFTNCSSWVRQNFWMSHLICHSKNNITSQSKWHDIHSVLILNEAHDLSYLFDIHVLNEAHDFSAVRMQLCSLIFVCNLISSAVWYCLHSFILFFLFNLNCTSTSLYILKLELAFLILYFFHYIVIKNDDIFQKETFVTNMMLSWHLVSLNYSSCISQIYISVCSFIALLKNSSSYTHILSLHVIIESQSLLMLINILGDA